jgi:hypothetical protein
VQDGVGDRLGDRQPKILQTEIRNARGTGELDRCAADRADFIGERGDAPG